MIRKSIISIQGNKIQDGSKGMRLRFISTPRRGGNTKMTGGITGSHGFSKSLTSSSPNTVKNRKRIERKWRRRGRRRREGKTGRETTRDRLIENDITRKMNSP